MAKINIIPVKVAPNKLVTGKNLLRVKTKKSKLL